MALSLLDTPAREVAAEALTWPDRARAAEVTDPDTYRSAAELLLGIKSLRTKVGQTFDQHIQTAHKAHKDLLAEKAKAETPLAEAEHIIKRSLADYDQAQEEARRAEQRRLEQEARKRAEDDALERAAAMELEGNQFGDAELVREAEALIAAPVEPMPVAPVAKATPQVKGITYRDVWKFEIVEPTKVPRQYLMVNESAIRSVVNGLKANANIPGVRVYCERQVAAGR